MAELYFAVTFTQVQEQWLNIGAALFLIPDESGLGSA